MNGGGDVVLFCSLHLACRHSFFESTDGVALRSSFSAVIVAVWIPVSTQVKVELWRQDFQQQLIIAVVE
jgi:hypothetical protein